MPKASLKMRLYNFIRENKHANYYELQEIAFDLGQKTSTMERRLRELSQAGLIEPIKNQNRHIIGYKLAAKNELKEFYFG